MKDPLAPKKPTTPFLAFCQVERAKMLMEFSTMSMKEVSMELAKRWATLDPGDKMAHEVTSMKAKACYEEEMKNYRPSAEFLQKKADESAKCMISQREVESYFAFLLTNWRQVLSAFPDQSGQEIQEAVWQEWLYRSDSQSTGPMTLGNFEGKLSKVENAPIRAAALQQKTCLKSQVSVLATEVDDDSVEEIFED